MITQRADRDEAPGVLGRLDSLLRDIERPLLMERSVKAIGGELRTGRFLISFPRAALGPGPSGRLRRICSDLYIPPQAMDLIDLAQKRAVSVHLGYEPEPDGEVYKCYLEFRPAETPLPGLVFLAVKWRGARWVQTRYWYRGGLSDVARQSLIAQNVPAGASVDLLTYFLALPECRDRLLEVEEPNSPRQSVDLNLAETQMSVGECAGRLRAFLRGTEAAQAYVSRHRDDLIGHLAAGRARDGNGFATLYHGATRVEGGLA